MQTKTLSRTEVVLHSLANAQTAVQRLLSAGVHVLALHSINGRFYIVCKQLPQHVEGLTAMSQIRTKGWKITRAILCGCVVEWREFTGQQSSPTLH